MVALGQLERTFREERAAVVATILGRTGDLQLAEDAVQAFAAAVVRWEADGVPQSPRAWLVVVAWRRALDRIRSHDARGQREERVTGSQLTPTGDPADDVPGATDDDLLKLIFACCHPALGPEVRVALTLRSVAGIPTAEVARLFVMPEATMAQRLVRAKRKIRDTGLRLEIPEGQALQERLEAVRSVIHLVLTAGVTAGGSDLPVEVGLCAEAVWLARLVARLTPDDIESAGLLVLCLLTHARTPARASATGRAVLLADQDRTHWDADLIAEGLDVLATSRRGRLPGSYWLEGAIAAEHARVADVARTDWTRIAALHRALAILRPDPVTAVARAVAVGRAEGPAAGLAVLRPIVDAGTLQAHAPLHAAMADLLAAAGEDAAAAGARARAAELIVNPTHRRAFGCENSSSVSSGA